MAHYQQFVELVVVKSGNHVMFVFLSTLFALLLVLRKKRSLEREYARRQRMSEDSDAMGKQRLSALGMFDGAEASQAPAAAEQPDLISSPRPPSFDDFSPGSQEQEDAALLTQYAAGDGGGVEEMERMLEQDPDNVQLLDWLAFMYYSNNEIQKAIEVYERIMSIDASNPSQHYYLGNCYYKAGHRDKAVEHWKAVIELKPGSKYARKAEEKIRKIGG